MNPSVLQRRDHAGGRVVRGSVSDHVMVDDAAPLPSPAAEPSLMGMPHAAEPWTAARVRALPDDGRRYELIEGELIVTPTPRLRHQVAVRELVRLLDPWLRTSGIAELLLSPADLSLGEDEILQPDLFVFPPASGPGQTEWSDIQSLLLAVEVVSPSTARYDRGPKRRRYQRAGVPEYWIVDLDARLVERWRPGDARPEVLADRLAWEPAPGLRLELDVREYFGSVAGDVSP